MRALAAAFTVVVWASPAAAAIEHDGDTDGPVFFASELTFDVTVGAGADRYLLLDVTTAQTSRPLQAASYAGAPFSLLGAASSPAGGCRIEWWGLVAPAEGTHELRVDLGGQVGSVHAGVASYRGVDQRRPVGRFSSAGGTQGPTAVTVAAADGDVVLDATCGWSPDSHLEIAGGEQIGRWHWSIGSLSAAASEAPGGPPSVTMTWTASGAGNMEWASGGVALRPSGTAPPDAPPPAGPAEVHLKVGTPGCAVGGYHPGVGEGIGPFVLALLALRRRRRREHPRPDGVQRDA